MTPRVHQVPSILIGICQNYHEQLIHFARVGRVVFRGHRGADNSRRRETFHAP